MSQGSVPMLRSYTGGAWRAGRGEGVPLHDAVTGEPIARISSAGIDMAAALDHGRRAGGPALRELTFHQRAALLKALASYLREHREELYALSARTGATPGDSAFDVDGGIAVLNAYASKGRRELPNDTVYVDGAVEPLSKGGTFAGQHIATSLRGVAIQINAFNFPVWGPLEKLAPAFLAGVPTLIKPASQTAYLTGKLAELIISSGLLPEGTVQLICGSTGDLLDHVTGQDLVLVHRVSLYRAAVARPSRARSEFRAFQRRSRLAQLLHPRPRRGRRHPRVRSVRAAAGDRDDGQGRAEVHGDPAGVRAGAADR